MFQSIVSFSLMTNNYIKPSKNVNKNTQNSREFERMKFDSCYYDNQRKGLGFIMERRKDSWAWGRSWIKFEPRSLVILLQKLERWCRACEEFKGGTSWWDGGRSFRLDLWSNMAGCFIQYTMWDPKGLLVFLEGKGLVGGWNVLDGKLKGFGIRASLEEK